MLKKKSQTETPKNGEGKDTPEANKVNPKFNDTEAPIAHQEITIYWR